MGGFIRSVAKSRGTHGFSNAATIVHIKYEQQIIVDKWGVSCEFLASPRVNWHKYGTWPFLIGKLITNNGKTHYEWPFSLAMIAYQRVNQSDDGWSPGRLLRPQPMCKAEAPKKVVFNLGCWFIVQQMLWHNVNLQCRAPDLSWCLTRIMGDSGICNHT